MIQHVCVVIYYTWAFLFLSDIESGVGFALFIQFLMNLYNTDNISTSKTIEGFLLASLSKRGILNNLL